MIQLSEEEFEDLVAEAVESLPPAFDEYLEEIVIDVEPMPDAETVERLGLRDTRTLLGLFHGVPLTEQSATAPRLWPNRVVIYQKNIERFSRTRRSALRQIRKTVLHEVGHHFGLNEDDLSALGYG